MNTQQIETIDSSRMQVLSDYRYVDEPINNIEHYYLGILDDKFMTRIRDLEGNVRGKVFFERANFAEVIAKMEDVFAGELKQQDVDYFIVKQGLDYLVIGITTTFPHTASAPIISFNLTNNRRAILDELQLGGWDLYMSIETGKKMLNEMKRIRTQVTNN
jgi:hypothetical protein